ncbi:MAG: hypothetical protein ACW98Y_01970 [Candidatus Thorarchaeota archaeon]
MAEFESRLDKADRLLTLTHPCDWCDMPKSEWTTRMNWRNQRKHYCSMQCYSAGEYKLNRYLCIIPTIILGIFCAFVISTFLTDLTTATIFATVTIIVVYLLFSSTSLTCVVLGRNKRMLRESEEGGTQ